MVLCVASAARGKTETNRDVKIKEFNKARKSVGGVGCGDVIERRPSRFSSRTSTVGDVLLRQR